MPIKPADQQRLDSVFAEHKASFGGRREDYFALLYLDRKFGKKPHEIGHQVAFNGNDYGIDAYHIDRDTRNLYLYQFKWTEDHRQFRGSMERIAKDGFDRIFGNPRQDPGQNDILTHLKADLLESREMIGGVYVHMVFKGDVDAIDRSESLAQWREVLLNKAPLLNAYFGRDVLYDVDYVADKPGRRPKPGPQVYDLKISGTGSVIHDDKRMRIGFVPLSELHGIYRSLGGLFFDRNIRASLSQDNAPNRKIREALDRIVLKEADEPSVFAFRHNGVTLAAARVEDMGDTLRVHVPRMLNGAQTVSSYGHFLEEHEGNPTLRRNVSRLNAISVLTKIVEDDPSSDFITQVTISNNQQNPVHPWALRAMDDRQVDLADKFRDEVGVYYSRQEGAFENLSDEEREELEITSAKDIRIKPLALTLLAVQGEIASMKSLPEIFESQRLYENTFKRSYLNADARAIVLGYKVGLMLNSVMSELRDVLPAKFEPAAAKAKNLAWALLIQALLNHRGYRGYLETWGTTLTKEAGFRDLLKQQVRTRVAPLIKKLCETPTYQTKVAEGKFDFLRTTEAFRRAMDEARDCYDWNKQSF